MLTELGVGLLDEGFHLGVDLLVDEVLGSLVGHNFGCHLGEKALHLALAPSGLTTPHK
jgi:hypothetical protein